MSFRTQFYQWTAQWSTSSWTGKLRFLLFCWHSKKLSLWIKIHWCTNRTKRHYDPQMFTTLVLYVWLSVSLCIRKLSVALASIISDSNINSLCFCIFLHFCWIVNLIKSFACVFWSQVHFWMRKSLHMNAYLWKNTCTYIHELFRDRMLTHLWLKTISAQKPNYCKL